MRLLLCSLCEQLCALRTLRWRCPTSRQRPPRRAEAGEPSERRHVQSLERGLAVMRAFSATSPTLTLADAARATGLTRATAAPAAAHLETLGYVSSDGRQFELTPKVLDLGYAYLSSFRLADIALPYMEELSAADRRVVLRGGARRHRDRLRGPGPDQAGDDHHAVGGEPAAGRDDLDGAGPARPTWRRTTWSGSRRAARWPAPTPDGAVAGGYRRAAP